MGIGRDLIFGRVMNERSQGSQGSASAKATADKKGARSLTEIFFKDDQKVRQQQRKVRDEHKRERRGMSERKGKEEKDLNERLKEEERRINKYYRVDYFAKKSDPRLKRARKMAKMKFEKIEREEKRAFNRKWITNFREEKKKYEKMKRGIYK